MEVTEVFTSTLKIITLCLFITTQVDDILCAPQRDANEITCAASKTFIEEKLQCCNEICCDQCPPGSFVIGPCRRGKASECLPCRKGTFSSGKYGSIRCTNCGLCDNGALNVKNCSLVSDTVCPCPKGKYLAEMYLKCQDCSKCPAGYGMVAECRTEDTVCKACPEGYFSNSTGMEPCNQCTQCTEGTKVVQECTSQQDAVCKKIGGSKGVSMTAFIVAVLILSMFIIVLLLALAVMYSYFKHRRPQPREPLLTTDVASEAHTCRGSSVSTLDQEKKVMKYIQGLDGQSFSTRSSLCDPPRLINSTMRLDKVEGSLIQRLGFYLNPRNTYKDWEALSGLLGYTPMQIKNFRLSEGNAFTETVLHDLCTKKPKTATLGYLFDKLMELEREDAADLIVEFDKKLSSERTETPV